MAAEREREEIILCPRIKTLLAKEFNEGLTFNQIELELSDRKIQTDGIADALEALIRRKEVVKDGDLYKPIIRVAALVDANKPKHILGGTKEEREATKEFCKSLAQKESQNKPPMDAAPVVPKDNGATKKSVGKKPPFYITFINYLKAHPDVSSQSEIAAALGVERERVTDSVYYIKKNLPEHLYLINRVRSAKQYKKEVGARACFSEIRETLKIGLALKEAVNGLNGMDDVIAGLRQHADDLKGLGFDPALQYLVAAADFIQTVVKINDSK